MKKKFDRENVVYVVVFSFVVCAVFVAGLAAANEATAPRVRANREFASQAAVLDALGIEYSDPAEAASLYGSAVRPIEGAVPRAYVAERPDGRHYVVEATGAGLWGAITIVAAAGESLERLDGIQILAQNETPGLGGRIDEPWFKDQFRGERVAGGRIRISAGAEAGGSGANDPEDGLVDGVSGATRTSQAMEQIVAAALARLAVVAGGGK